MTVVEDDPGNSVEARLSDAGLLLVALGSLALTVHQARCSLHAAADVAKACNTYER